MGAVSLNVITDLLFCNNFPTFVIEMDKSMETTVIKIGNSRGIIIPSAILKKLGVKEGDKVKLEEKDGACTLTFLGEEEEPYTGPYTGPFKALAACKDMDDPWGWEDAVEYVRKLRDDTNAEARVIDWGDL